MAVYIISDLHLSNSRPDLLNAFENFVLKLNHNDQLIIAGDLFDFYIGLDKKNLAQNCVKEVLGKAKERGIKCFFQRGNRDFLLREKEALALNLRLLPNFHIVQSTQGACLILHGDDLCTNDVNYLKFKRIVSKKWLQFLFRRLPLCLRKKIAKSMRQKSLHTIRDNPDIYGINKDTLKAFVNVFEVQNIIHGHLHIFEKTNGEVPNLKFRLGLGAWDHNFSYVRIDRNGIAMVEKDLEILLQNQDDTEQKKPNVPQPN